MGYKDQLKAAQKSGNVRVLKPVWYEWTKKGQQVLGLLTGVVELEGKNFKGKFNKYSMQTDDGPVQFKLGAASDADTGVFMEVGNVYLIEYTGDEDTGKGNPRHTFQITLVDAAPELT